MLNLSTEISYEPPPNTAVRSFKEGEPVLYAFDCVLLERDTGKNFVYTAANLKNGKSKVLIRRNNPMNHSVIENMVERIRVSGIAGASRFQADKVAGDRLDYKKACEILKAVFMEFLPRYGYTIRKEQIDLAEHILSEITRRGVTLAEAEVGTGKTLAYLVPAIIAKRGRINDFWNMSLYPDMQYADMSKMPIVIATSSIALQRALLTDYIPELSRILLKSRVIKEPLTAILRKGKEHYICEHNLRYYLTLEHDAATRKMLEDLLLPDASFDLADIDVTPHVKRQISVSGFCSPNCQYRDGCQYRIFRDHAQSLTIDIQVCNHNYILADTIHRANGLPALVPNYQILVIDEAHKFLQAARSMYGAELSSVSLMELSNTAEKLELPREARKKFTRKAVSRLCFEGRKFYDSLLKKGRSVGADEDTGQFPADIGNVQARHLRNICYYAKNLLIVLHEEAIYAKAMELLDWVGKNYNANTASINVGQIFTGATGRDIEIEDLGRYQIQILILYKAICDLPEIQSEIENEKHVKRSKQHRCSPEQQTIYLETSHVEDKIWQRTRRLSESGFGKFSEWIVKLIWDVEKIYKQAAMFIQHNDLVCWLEIDRNETRLCAIPKDIDTRLFDAQWSKGISTILTSGTLSAASDFSHIKRTLGLSRVGIKLSETCKPSPFNHKENSLLYISESVPFPNQRDGRYIAAVTDEIERLIFASHGHAAVLFTSYKVMGKVHTELKKRNIPFPLLRLDKGGVRVIERFKQSGNGVLFASGALWEGIDIPGDALSMLIIVKLPFAVPDPISKYEQSLYQDMNEYKERVVTPEMLIKLKQGDGRLLRKEDDTGAVAILDSRVNRSGAYRSRVLAALPDRRVTSNIDDIAQFFKDVKTPDYFS